MKRIEALVPSDKVREVRDAIQNAGAGGLLITNARGQGSGERPEVSGARGTGRHTAEYNTIESIMTIVDDQVINPSKVINEQFVPVVLTKLNGEMVSGVIVNLKGDVVILNTDLADPNQRVNVDRKEVEKIEPSKISTMPPGLLYMLSKEEILDMTAYVLSGGDSDHRMFSKK